MTGKRPRLPRVAKTMDTFTARITSALKREPVSREGLDDDQKGVLGRVEIIVSALNEMADHRSAPRMPRESEHDRCLRTAISWSEVAERHRITLMGLPGYAVSRRYFARSKIRHAEAMVMHNVNFARRSLDHDRGIA